MSCDTPTSILPLPPATSLQELVVATGPAVLACSVADPFMVLLMEDGSVQLLTVEVGRAEEEVGRAEEEVGRAEEEVGRAEEEEGRARLVQSTPQLGEVRGTAPVPVCLLSFYLHTYIPCVTSKLLPLSSIRCPRLCVCLRL